MARKEDKQTPTPGKIGDKAGDHESCHVQTTNQDSSATTSDQDEQPHQVPKTDKKPLTSSQKRMIMGIALATFLSGTPIAVLIPFFPVEAASRGISQKTISAVFSSYAMTRLILGPIVGRLAPVIGVTRVYNIGIAITGVTTIVFGALNHIGDTQLFVAACFLMRMAEAVGMSAVSGCGYTIIANQFPERINTMMALVNAGKSLSLSLAPAIGSGLYAAGGFSLPFYVLGGMMVGAAALNHWFMPPLDRYQRHLVPYLSMLRVFSKSWQNWLCLVTVFHFTFVLLTFDASVAPYADKVLGITPSTLGLYFTVATLAHVLTSFLWAQMAQRARRPHAMMGVGSLVTSVSLLLIPPSPLLDLTPHWWLFGLGMTLMEGSFGAASIPCFQLMLAEGLRQGLPNDLVTQAFMSSVMDTAFSLGNVVGPLVSGFIVDGYGFPFMMTALAGLVLLVGLLNLAYAVFATHPVKTDEPATTSKKHTPMDTIQSD